MAGYSDPSYVRQLWDVHLKAAVDAAAAKRSGGGTDRQSDGDEADTTPELEAAAAEVACLGERFYPSAARCANPSCLRLAPSLLVAGQCLLRGKRPRAQPFCCRMRLSNGLQL